MTTIKHAILFVISLLVLTAALSVPVFADGQYGQYGVVTEKPSEKPKEEVVHETVEADLGDNLVLMGLMLGVAGAGFGLIAKVTRRVYLFE